MRYNHAMKEHKPKERERRQGSSSYRLSVDTIREVKRGMDAETNRLVDDLGMKWEGADPGMRSTLMPGHLMAGLFTWFLGLPELQRNEILKEGLDLYVKRLDGDPKAPFSAPLRKDAKLRGAGGYTAENTGDTPKPKGKHFGPDSHD
jgi:hypothetical protein